MSLLTNIRFLGQYNQRMNAQFYAACRKLSPAMLKEDRQAYFGSVIGTLNHIMVGDIIWLKRFANHPANFKSLEPVRQLAVPTSLDQILHEDFNLLAEKRAQLDLDIIAWTEELSEQDLEIDLAYRNSKGTPFTRAFGSLALHLFNHQTHHRGQVSTLLHQSGVDVGVTDFFTVVPDLLKA